jgi:hypothetical protein
MEKHFIHKKIITVLLLICFITAFFFSVIYIDLHSSHNCTGHLCTTCENLNFACKIINQIGMSVKSINTISLVCIVFLLYSVPFLFSIKKHITLINLKVRLDN